MDAIVLIRIQILFIILIKCVIITYPKPILGVNEIARNSNSENGEIDHDYMLSSTHKWNNTKTINEPSSTVDETDKTCLLGSAQEYLSWWLNNNGTLVAGNDNIDKSAMDFSFAHHTSSTLVNAVKSHKDRLLHNPIIFMSVACSNLTRVPKAALSLISGTLTYLSLKGNTFLERAEFYGDDDNLLSWADFPLMVQLKQLDLRNCEIRFIYESIFLNLPSLDKLFLSNNNIVTISTNTFLHLSNLSHLDLSHNQAIWREHSTMTDIDPTSKHYQPLKSGIDISNDAFVHMKKLLLLDVSFSKITSASVRAFSFIPESVQLLSLCHTSLPAVPCGMFNGTNLLVLDLSGNPKLANSFDKLNGLENSLEILSIESSGVNSLLCCDHLHKLKILQTASNDIQQINSYTFRRLKSIEVIDLSFNQISTWHTPIFQFNNNLRILKLQSNNITAITTEMFIDFNTLDFLSLGNNHFDCDCNLRDFVDIAALNNKQFKYTVIDQHSPNLGEMTNKSVLDSYSKILAAPRHTLLPSKPKNHHIVLNSYDIGERILYGYLSSIERSFQNMVITKAKHIKYKLKIYKGNNTFNATNMIKSVAYICNNSYSLCMPNTSTLNFTFQLSDYSEDNYHCTNISTNKYHLLTDIENCAAKRTWDLIEYEHTVNMLAMVFGLLGGFLLIFLLICYKWWYVRYFFIIIKNATILSFLEKDKTSLHRMENVDSASNYDVFVSYCDGNRDWILDELLPNIENTENIKVCLHERDFQVGLSILENIIACMDRSRCLLLIVSQTFLLSQWCQFEMHLAQHRLLETGREQLILILLEDIPKRKRPKTLHYLMRTKTYLKWPEKKNATAKDNLLIAEERKLFWKRLRKVLADNEMV